MRERLIEIVTASAPPLPERPAPGSSAGPQLAWLWRRAKHGWPARYPLAQFPNAPLLLSFAGALLAGQVLGAGAAPYARAAALIFLACWAWVEVSSGVNLLRRLLGAGFLVAIVADVGQRLS